MKAIIMGFSPNEIGFSPLCEKEIETEKGKAHLFIKEDIVFVPRHGKDKTIPPHMINHCANILGLKSLGVSCIIAINSVGSLKENITPDDFLIPDDYINLWDTRTLYDEKIVHILPGLDEEIRILIKDKAMSCGINPIDGGVYVQTKGPRLETKAEIRFLKTLADVVGMTLASEATIAKELEIPYASLCLVDNYCNGIKEEPLSFSLIKEYQKKKMGVLKKFLNMFI
ncbi:MAG: MTAP family purine nucleoside phosphorylase [bacterium]